MGILASPRRRRRLVWFGVLLAVGLTVGLALAFMRNTAPAHKEKFTNGPPVVAPKEVVANHTHRERVSALAVAIEFLRTAVLREHIDRSWSITEPSLRAGYTRKAWDSGNSLPFPPYHFAEVRWRPDYSYRDSIGLVIALFPAKTEHQKPAVFYLDLKRHGRGKHERWLVSEFAPAPVEGSTPIPASAGSTLHLSLAQAPASKAPLSAAWLLVPLSALSLIVLVPLALGIRGLIRSRRAERAYEAKVLPPLTPRDG
jgi:hypothetical protein